MQLAYIKDEPGFEAGLSFQISPHIEHFASLVWSFPFGEIFHAPLRRATDRFDPYGMCEIPSPCWVEIARAAEELGIKAQGHAAVRVRRVEPSEKDRKRLRDGKPAASLPPVSGRELQGLRARIPAKVR